MANRGRVARLLLGTIVWIGIVLLAIGGTSALVMAFLKSPTEFIAACTVIGGFCAFFGGCAYAIVCVNTE